jgi:hypothetical protein
MGLSNGYVPFCDPFSIPIYHCTHAQPHWNAPLFCWHSLQPQNTVTIALPKPHFLASPTFHPSRKTHSLIIGHQRTEQTKWLWFHQYLQYLQTPPITMQQQFDVVMLMVITFVIERVFVPFGSKRYRWIKEISMDQSHRRHDRCNGGFDWVPRVSSRHRRSSGSFTSTKIDMKLTHPTNAHSHERRGDKYSVRFIMIQHQHSKLPRPSYDSTIITLGWWRSFGRLGRRCVSVCWKLTSRMRMGTRTVS